MSLKDCMIKNGFTEKEIDGITGGQPMNEAQFVDAANLAQKELKEKNRIAKIQMVSIGRAMNVIKTNPNSAAHGFLSLFAFEKRKGTGVASIDIMAEHFARKAFAEMSDMMETLMPKTSEFWKVDDLLRTKIVREIYGESTGDAQAKAFAKSFIDANENLRVYHNKIGGNIKKDPHWFLPQSHNGLKIRKVSRQQWADELLKDGVLDLENMTNSVTGEAFKSAEELRPFLNNMYDSIVTNGASKMDWEAAQFLNIKAARGVKSRERFLRFKGGDSYLDYQKKYGEDNIYSAMITHIKGLAQDTALIKQLGPNPGAAFNYLKAKTEVLTPKRGVIFDKITRAENVMKELTGELAGTNTRLQQGTETLRAINVTKLGGASISAIGDQGTLHIAAAIHGLPIFKTTINFLKQMAGGHAERQFLLQSGVNADHVIDIASGLARYGENDANSAWGKFAALPDRFIRLSGLNKMTEAGRASIQLSTLGHLANVEKTKWADLSAGNRRLLDSGGITEQDWAVMSKSKKQRVKGAQYLDMRELPFDLQVKVGNMMDVIAYRAIPAPDVEVRAMMRQGTEAGTVPGEFMRSFGQFKSFGISILLYQIEFSKQFGKTRGAAYLAGTFVTLTAFGMIAAQIKQLAAGKEMMNMDKGASWLTAAAQGGGLGIFADFIFKDQSRFGAGILSTSLGPSAATFETIVGNLMLAPTQKAFIAIIDADPEGFEALARQYGVDLTEEVRKLLPTQLWYTKLVFDRYVFQTISQLSDPSYINKLYKREAKMEKDENRGLLFDPIEL